MHCYSLGICIAIDKIVYRHTEGLRRRYLHEKHETLEYNA